MTVITVDNLIKSYTTYKRGSGFRETLKSFVKREPVTISAVDNISFSIEKGSICGILGPNGAGKSTTIKMLCGALYPTGGKIDVMGYSPARDRMKYVRRIGAVFGQKSQLIWDIPPIDSFAMNKAIYGIKSSDYKKRLDEMTALFEVGEVIHKPTRVLSLGERMKCEFIMAMLHSPDIVFLDEPTIGLDVIAKAKIRNVIDQMNQNGTTFILTTHDLEDVEQLADRVIIINHGKKVFDDTLPRLKSTLGNKKIIKLTLSKPYNGKTINGADVIQRESELDISLEVDMEKQGINEFLNHLSKSVIFTDISVKELPMDMIITRIYSE
ncbi:MAG: Daunorubicin/doxorubicin resistance ATP-binding protein DrrA [Firmicutes bacterium ADurb.Bin419]|nr:MAG: Daunorubicin/doxorubicin resistance ATP-binding protein DrrA [Firmicutes bacterium ADurb.Bin419]